MHLEAICRSRRTEQPYQQSRRCQYLALLPRLAHYLWYYAPPSASDVTPLYNSGSSSATEKLAPAQKLKTTPAEQALVATSKNVELNNAKHILNSSDRETSATSPTVRQRLSTWLVQSASWPKPEYTKPKLNWTSLPA